MEEVFGRQSVRPTHPDFWRISEVMLGLDAGFDEPGNDDVKERLWHERTSAVVDVESITYMAMQRVFMALGRPANRAEAIKMSTIVALVVDSFVAGATFQQHGGHQ